MTQKKIIYSVVSLVGPRLEETVLATLLRKIFKRPSILGQKGHRYPPKHSKVSYYHFDGWLETSNHPLFAAWQTLWPKLLLTNGNKAYIVNTSVWGVITSIGWTAADQQRRGDVYLLPAAQQSGQISHLNVSRGTCDLCLQELRIFWKFSSKVEPR